MKNLMMFVLGSGQEVIGEIADAAFHSTSGPTFTLNKPMAIHLVPQRDSGHYSVMLAPFSPVNPDSTFKFHTHAITAEHLEIPKDIFDAYIRQTSSIEIVSSLNLPN